MGRNWISNDNTISVLGWLHESHILAVVYGSNALGNSKQIIFKVIESLRDAHAIIHLDVRRSVALIGSYRSTSPYVELTEVDRPLDVLLGADSRTTFVFIRL